jgi:hypothetical protein
MMFAAVFAPARSIEWEYDGRCFSHRHRLKVTPSRGLATYRGTSRYAQAAGQEASTREAEPPNTTARASLRSAILPHP